MKDIPCHLVLSVKDGLASSYETPLDINVRGLRGFDPPPSVDRDSPYDVIHLPGEKAAFGVMMVRGKDGLTPWFLLSWLPTVQSFDHAEHTKHVCRYELAPEIVWAPMPVSITMTWRKRDMGLMRFNGYLSRANKMAVVHHFGSPTGHAEWLAVRLLPRRRPATMRVGDDGAGLLYTPLDTI